MFCPASEAALSDIELQMGPGRLFHAVGLAAEMTRDNSRRFFELCYDIEAVKRNVTQKVVHLR